MTIRAYAISIVMVIPMAMGTPPQCVMQKDLRDIVTITEKLLATAQDLEEQAQKIITLTVPPKALPPKKGMKRAPQTLLEKVYAMPLAERKTFVQNMTNETFKDLMDDATAAQQNDLRQLRLKPRTTTPVQPENVSPQPTTFTPPPPPARRAPLLGDIEKGTTLKKATSDETAIVTPESRKSNAPSFLGDITKGTTLKKVDQNAPKQELPQGKKPLTQKEQLEEQIAKRRQFIQDEPEENDDSNEDWLD